MTALVAARMVVTGGDVPSTCSQTYFHLQEAQRVALARDLGVDLLCALVNNNSRCYDESLDFADHMGQILPVGQGVRAATFAGAQVLTPRPAKAVMVADR